MENKSGCIAFSFYLLFVLSRIHQFPFDFVFCFYAKNKIKIMKICTYFMYNVNMYNVFKSNVQDCLLTIDKTDTKMFYSSISENHDLG